MCEPVHLCMRDVSDVSCAAGPLCTECTDGRVLTASFECSECLHAALLWMLLGVAALGGVLLLYYFVLDLRQGDTSAVSGLVKVAVSVPRFPSLTSQA